MTTKRKNPPKRRTLEEQIKYDEQKLAQAEEAAAKAKENIRRRKAAMKKKRLETLGRFTEYAFQKTFKYACSHSQENELSENDMIKYMLHFFKKELENIFSDEKSDIKAQNWSNYVLPQIELIAEEEARKYEKAQKAQAQPKPQQPQSQGNHAPQKQGA